MPRHMLRDTLAAVLIAAAAAVPATGQDILVTGPGERIVDRTDFGAEVVEDTTSLVVNVRDLDLASTAGRKAMERRLTTASRVACNVIEQRIPIDLRRDRSECEMAAYRGAIARARALAKTPTS